jgi:hypothetical protein
MRWAVIVLGCLAVAGVLQADPLDERDYDRGLSRAEEVKAHLNDELEQLKKGMPKLGSAEDKVLALVVGNTSGDVEAWAHQAHTTPIKICETLLSLQKKGYLRLTAEVDRLAELRRKERRR